MGHTLTVRLDDDVARALDEAAKRTSRPKGRIVRDALRAHLVSDNASVLGALAKYAGVVDGPRDLSTNKKHLASLGRPRRDRGRG